MFLCAKRGTEREVSKNLYKSSDYDIRRIQKINSYLLHYLIIFADVQLFRNGMADVMYSQESTTAKYFARIVTLCARE